MAPNSIIPIVLFLAFLPAVLCLGASAQEQTNPLVNAGFDKDLAGWDVQGNAVIETSAPLSAPGSLRLGPGKAAVSQRYVIGGPRIVEFGATLKADPPDAGGSVRVRCYDAHDRLLMDLRQGTDPKKTGSNYIGLYFKTQAHTTSIIVSIEKDTATAGYVYADAAKLDDYDHDRVTHAPLCDLHQYLQPIWQGRTVYNETVLLESVGGKPATGALLFAPKQILSVRDYGLTTDYVPGKDYTLDGRTIIVTPGTHMTTVKDTDFPAGDIQWYELNSKHVVVTYTHDDTWGGPVPRYEGDQMPHTMNKLRRGLPLTVVADGDSITLGDNVSGYMQTPPYMPTWAELFVDRLRQSYGDSKITLYNTALGGMTSEWGQDTADSMVAALDPDLVIIAFGMNDFWSLSPEEFRKNIQGIIERVRVRRPRAEFLLIASMRFDPAYTSDPMYAGHMAGYVTALRSLTGTGVRLLDMNAISGALFAAKKPKDLIANPLHPNDFLARWYAQGLAAMLEQPSMKQARRK